LEDRLVAPVPGSQTVDKNNACTLDCEKARCFERRTWRGNKTYPSLLPLDRNVARPQTSMIREHLKELTVVIGRARRLSNGVSGLSPQNPALKIINSVAMTAPYHSIIGDRGKGDSVKSTDGVVPYSSPRLDGAKSELIVPGPHGSFNSPQPPPNFSGCRSASSSYRRLKQSSRTNKFQLRVQENPL